MDFMFDEPSNGGVRQECLDENWSLSLEDARDKVEAWRQEYNTMRPHSAPGQLRSAWLTGGRNSRITRDTALYIYIYSYSAVPCDGGVFD